MMSWQTHDKELVHNQTSIDNQSKNIWKRLDDELRNNWQNVIIHTERIA